MTRVLHLDLGTGFRGGQRQVALLAGAQAGVGRDVLVLTASPALGRLLASLQVPHQQIPANPWLRLPLLRRRARAFTLVHAHDARAHALGALLGRPLLVHRRIDDPPRDRGTTRRKYQRGSFVAVSEAVGRVLAEYGVSAERRRVVHSGVPVAEPVGPPQDGPLRVLTLGALVAHKGHADLLDAASALPGIRFDLLGDGPLRSSLEARAPSNVRFLGDPAGSLPDLSPWDLLAHPSRTEGLGTAVLDAQAAGLPVLSTNAGGLPEATAPCCFSCPAGDPAALAGVLRQIADEPRDALRRRGRAARAWVHPRFSVERMRDEMDEAYTALLTTGTVNP